MERFASFYTKKFIQKNIKHNNLIKTDERNIREISIFSYSASFHNLNNTD